MSVRSNIAMGFIVSSLAAAFAPAQAVVVASATPSPVGNTVCAPMVCPLRYQQVISASFFSAPISISNITFGNANSPSAMPAANAFSITFSTARRGVGSISEDFAGNAGLDASLFFTGSYQGSTQPTFSIYGNAFNYDPSRGDLLIDIQRLTPGADFTLNLDGNQRYFTSPNGGAGSDYVFTYNPDFFTGVQRSSGLTLGFNEATGTGPGSGGPGSGGAGSAVPEPATWGLMLIGFGMAGTSLRGRRAVSRAYGKSAA